MDKTLKKKETNENLIDQALSLPEISASQPGEREEPPEQETPEDIEQTPAEKHQAIKHHRALLQRKPAALSPAKDEVAVKIEKIMEEGLNDAYQRLSPIAKQEFRLKGEQTAVKIRQLLKATHIKVKKILRLILDWLRMLPGINRFFLEQEAKIKTDRIVALKK